MKNITSIIWDWNGTLLDDVSLCVSTMNQILSDRGIDELTYESYRDVFMFPVKDYYTRIGFDFNKESFDHVSDDFISRYLEDFNKTSLHGDSLEALKHFKHEGMIQYMLSSMKQDYLDTTLYRKGIKNYFYRVYGAGDIYAYGKLDIAKKLLEKEQLILTETLMIGDTLHDFDVANALGVECVLVANGHQSKNRLLNTKAIVVENLSELIPLVS